MTKRIGAAATLPLEEVQTFHRNPRRGNVPAIQESIIKNGQFKPLIVNAGTHTGRKNEVLAGNHTLLAIRELSGTEHELTEVDVYLVDVTDEEANRIVLADNRTSDLGTYDQHDLVALLTDLDHDLDGTGYDYDDLDDLSALLEGLPSPTENWDPHDDDSEGNDPDDDWDPTETDDRGEDTTPDGDRDGGELTDEEYRGEIDRLHDKYTHAATAPVYEPQEEEPPALSELVDTSKTEKLLTRIDAAEGVPADVKGFLRAAAHRHTVINFKKVAEWYAHQPGEIQELAEQQALVIIDLQDALRHGYARLTGELRRYALQESGYDDAHPDPQHRNPHLDLTPEDEAIRGNARTRSNARLPEENQ